MIVQEICLVMNGLVEDQEVRGVCPMRQIWGDWMQHCLLIAIHALEDLNE